MSLESTSTSPVQQPIAKRRFRHRDEATRDRDVLRYVQTWERMYRPTNFDKNINVDGDKPPKGASCPDTAITALSQLAAIRMHGRRCLVSLTCAIHDWVLADSGPRTALQHTVKATDSYDVPMTGTARLARSDSLSDAAITTWQTARSPRSTPSEQGHYYTDGLTQHSFVIQDLWREEEYRKVGLARLHPWIRFYCSVPIRDALGSVLGSLALFDDKPRFGVSVDEVALLEDLSDTISQHLSATLTKARSQRGQRVIAALSSFCAGETSLREWLLAQDDIRVSNTGRTFEKGTAAERSNRIDVDLGSKVTPDDLASELSDMAPPAVELYEPTTTGPSAADVIDHTSSTQKFDIVKATTTTHQRAMNLLREALGATGVALMDATNVVADPALGQSGNSMRASHSRRGSKQSQGRDTSDSDSSTHQSDRLGKCKVLAVSTRTCITNDGTEKIQAPIEIPEQYLQRMIEQCPRGAVCFYDVHGRIYSNSAETSSSISSSEEIPLARRRRRKDFQILSEIFPQAKVLSVYPIWDDHVDRWRSCIFAWSDSISYCLDQREEITYLRTFAHSLIVELSRLESVAANLAKTSFISSISHELRSPLHGVLAGVEFLHDTTLSDFQREMTHAIGLAGKTLLDTVNHVLDYAKLKGSDGRHTRDLRGASLNRIALDNSRNTDASGAVDLASLTEEVIETIVTGHRFGRRTSAFRTSGSTQVQSNFIAQSTSYSFPTNTQKPSASIVLKITHRKSWTAVVQPGAWTRLLTNLVGNAIKYTPDGHINVELHVDKIQGLEFNDSQSCQISLIISDTGVGISEAFLAHDLYQPFKQENPHIEGTGLGLSIVKHITREMGATLSVKSTQGRGTQVQVKFVADFPVETTFLSKSSPEDDFKTRLANLKVSELCTFRESSLEATASADILLHSVSSIAENWLKCRILSADNEISHIHTSSACVITENDLLKWQQRDPAGLHDLWRLLTIHKTRLYVLACSMQTTTPPEIDLPPDTVFIMQPIGPRKLLRAMTSNKTSIIAPLDSLQKLELRTSAIRSKDHPLIGRTTSTRTSNEPEKVSSHPNFARSQSLSASDAPVDNLLAGNSDISPGAGSATSTRSGTYFRVNDNARDDLMAGPRDTVLLVEDNPINMKVSHLDVVRPIDIVIEDTNSQSQFLIVLIKKLKIRYLCAVNGLEAVKKYTASPDSFFLVLMDMSMPVMDGFAATANIRHVEKSNHLRRTSIIALTGVTDQRERDRAFDSGVDEYYNKPIKMQKLREMIDDHWPKQD